MGKVQNGRHLEKYLIKKQISFKQNNKVNCTSCKESVKHSMRSKYTNECQRTSPFCLHGMTVIWAVHKIEVIIKYYSTIKKEFHILPKYFDKLNKFSLSKTLKDFKVIDKLSVSIKSTVTNAKYIIKLKDKSCSCCFWLKKKFVSIALLGLILKI